MRDRKFLHATALLMSSMVGVGIFGIPFVFTKAGFAIGLFWLVVLAVITCLYDLAFAELILRTQGAHQIVGYANIWLGPWARRIAFLAQILAGYGTLLAYMVIAGGFLHTVLSQYIAINPDWYAILFALIWSVLVMVRIRTIALIDMVMMALVVAVVGIIAAFGLPHVDFTNFRGVTWEYWFLPYGVIMFALSGANAIPIQRQLLAGREKLLKPAIITAVAGASLLYALFAFTVVGVSGDVTTPDAISGLYGIVGGGIVLLGSVLGIMTISTSFLMVATSLHETFHLDYRVNPVFAWLLVIAPPLFFFVSGLRNFIDIIGLVGSVAVGVLAAGILAAYVKARKISFRQPEWTMNASRLSVWAVGFVFGAGVLYKLVMG